MHPTKVFFLLYAHVEPMFWKPGYAISFHRVPDGINLKTLTTTMADYSGAFLFQKLLSVNWQNLLLRYRT